MPPNPAQNDSLILQVAAEDWARTPYQKIKEKLGINQQQMNHARSSQLYKDTVEGMKKEWLEQMLSSPGTQELRRELSYTASLAAKRIQDVLSNDAATNKDWISAARLAFQVDGRFWSQDQSPEDPDRDVTKIAPELVQALKRVKERIQ